MKTTVFLSNRSQAVSLPKAVALPDDVKHVEIIAVGKHGELLLQTMPGTTGFLVMRPQWTS